jgi:nucleotide-binding universal stress UspA family protein
MKKKTTILVPTDFSAASRPALRFAIQWARQQRSKIIFTHVLDIMKFADWNKKKFEAYADEQRTMAISRLRGMLSGILSRLEDIDFICMGTNGAGTFQRVIGTNTGNLIRR